MMGRNSWLHRNRYRPKGVLPQRCSAHFWRILECSSFSQWNKTRFGAFLTHFWRILVIADTFSENTFRTIPTKIWPRRLGLMTIGSVKDKQKTHKQIFRGIAPGFLSDFVYVFFPHKEWSKNRINKIYHPPSPSPGTILHMCLYLCVCFPWHNVCFSEDGSVHFRHGNPQTVLLRTFLKAHRFLWSTFSNLCVQAAMHSSSKSCLIPLRTKALHI